MRSPTPAVVAAVHQQWCCRSQMLHLLMSRPREDSCGNSPPSIRVELIRSNNIVHAQSVVCKKSRPVLYETVDPSRLRVCDGMKKGPILPEFHSVGRGPVGQKSSDSPNMTPLEDVGSKGNGRKGSMGCLRGLADALGQNMLWYLNHAR